MGPVQQSQGGVASGIGKGITISSIGVLLKAMGFRVTSIKIDPYLNVDAGTMSPFEHGEVFVLKDGGEGDLDLGNYERFLDIELTKDHNITTGKVYQSVIARERRGDYLGKTVQVVPHITNAIQDWIERVAYQPVDGLQGPPDICLVEVGGTVGDIESMVFLEALRQFQFRAKRENISFVHVSLVPALNAVGEQKTKPTQHGVKQLMMAGLQPDLLVCRSQNELEKGIAAKLAMFCHVDVNNVLSVHDVSNIYHVPNMLHQQGLPNVVCQSLNLIPPMALPSPMLIKWNQMAEAVDTFAEQVVIAVVGKYTGLADAYLSVIKALKHSAIAAGRKLRIDWVEATNLQEETSKTNKTEYDQAWATMKAADGVLVPGGFGVRGVEGKILAANYARTSKTPYLGVCLGMQCAVIEWARNMCGLKDANSTEFDEHSANPVSSQERQLVGVVQCLCFFVLTVYFFSRGAVLVHSMCLLLLCLLLLLLLWSRSLFLCQKSIQTKWAVQCVLVNAPLFSKITRGIPLPWQQHCMEMSLKLMNAIVIVTKSILKGCP